MLKWDTVKTFQFLTSRHLVLRPKLLHIVYKVVNNLIHLTAYKMHG